MTFGEFIGRTRLVIHYPSVVNLQYGMRIAHSIWQISCRDNPQSMSVILTSSACLLSWVMARRKSLSICTLPWVMVRLCTLDWVLVRSASPSWAMDWLGYLSWAMDWLGSLSWAWIGEGLSLRALTGVKPSLSRPGSGRDYLSWRRDNLSLGQDNLNMCQMCPH